MQIKLQGFLLSALVAMTIIGAWGTALAQDEEDYTPAFEVGSGVADWWTAYPDQHENASRPVQHPGWVLDDLKEKPVLILVHASYCKPCLVHNPRIESALGRLGQSISYHDVLAEGDGYLEALNILNVYDPDGGMQYIPTTIFITLAQGPKGDVEVVWHSQTDTMSQEDIDSYLKDAIYYHQKNKSSWR